jgi:predicted permease
MVNILSELKHALRALWRNPGFSIAVVLILALGIGANTTVFLWIKAILLQPLPGVPAPREVVDIAGLHEMRGRRNFSYPEYVDLREHNSVLSGFAVHYMQGVGMSGAGEPERAWTELVSANFFDVLGVQPSLGRFFRQEEDHLPLGDPVAVISHGLWQGRYAGDPGVVGALLTVNGESYTIIGVAPEGFGGAYTGLVFDLWIPITRQPHLAPGGSWLEARDSRWLEGFGRLAPGVEPEQAQSQLSTMMLASAREQNAQGDWPTAVTVRFLRNSTGGPEAFLGPLLLALMTLVGLVLLITCANVAGLMLARAADRRREFAVRLSMGSTRWQLARLLLSESLLLAVLGGMLATFTAVWGAQLFPAMIPLIEMPVAFKVALNLQVLAFTFGLSLLSGLLCALAPIRHAIYREIAQELRAGSGRTSATRKQRHGRDLLVGAQVALSMVLLFTAGLFIRSATAAHRADVGFNPAGVLVASIDLFPANVSGERGLNLYQGLLDRLSALPGVEIASLSRRIPLSFSGSSSTELNVPGYVAPPNDSTWTHLQSVGPDYFRLMEIPVLAGREFTRSDTASGEQVAVVSNAFVRRYLPGRDPIGQTLQVDGGQVTIVGVAADIKHQRLEETAGPQLYIPALQSFLPRTTLHVRTSASPAALAGDVRQVIREVAPDGIVFNVGSLEDRVAAAALPQRLGAVLLAALGALVLLIAGVGLHGLLAFTVRQRMQEIGIRRALGARHGDVVRLVAGRGLTITCLGLGLGGFAALALGHLLSSITYGVSPFDPVSLGGALTSLLAVGLVASLAPVLLALGVAPVEALRYE